MLSERLRQHCLKKILCNFALMLLGKHCTGQNLMQYCPKSSRQHCIRKNSMQCCLNTLWTTLHSWKPYASCPRGSRQLCLRKMFHSMLAAYAVLVLCNVPCSKHHCTGKTTGNSGNIIWTTYGDSVYICIYQVLFVKKIQSNAFFTMKIYWN